MPTPAFPAHIYSMVLAGGKVVDVPLDTSPEFFDRLDDLVADAALEAEAAGAELPAQPDGR